MKRKPIKIDWDELEEAFSNPGHDTEAYLDRVTGHVFLGGEGDDLELDEDETAFGNAAAVANATTARQRQDPTRVRIDPPDTALKIQWLEAFLDGRRGEEHAAINAELRAAIESDSPAEALGAILNANTDVRDDWYIYRSEQIQGLIDRWLTENEIRIVGPPPWRAG